MASRRVDRGVVQSLDRALSILDVLSLNDGPGLGLGEISARAHLPKSTVHRLLATLDLRGFVIRDPTTGSYRLGLKGMRHAGSGPEIRAVLSDLAVSSGETANLGVLTGADVVYVDRVESPQALRWELGVGSRVPAHCSGMGKAILAFLDRDLVRRLLPAKLRAHTGRTFTDRDALLAELGAIRTRGFAFDDEEFMDGVRCVAVPVWGGHDDVAGAVSLAGPAFRLTTEVAATQVRPLQHAALRIARIMTSGGSYPQAVREAR
jgi:DNA-binding IclR family transcriptional regulator